MTREELARFLRETSRRYDEVVRELDQALKGRPGTPQEQVMMAELRRLRDEILALAPPDPGEKT